MKICHELHKPNRYMKQYWGVQLDFDEPAYWWDGQIWTLDPDWTAGSMSNTFHNCRSVRAFTRRLREWSEYLPSGTRFRLIGRYVGQDVIGIT